MFFDHDMAYVNGGVELLIAQIHDRGNYAIAIKNMSYILYNMVQRDIYDPSLFEKFEAQYKMLDAKHIECRHCFGALYAYYKSNQGSRYGIDFWEALFDQRLSILHVQEIAQLLEAFRHNRQLHRSHMLDKLTTQFKQVILDKWKSEVIYNQRVLFDLASELH